jgi:hypothetical protein
MTAVDLFQKVRELVGSGKRTRLATEAELAGAYPMFEFGAVPPVRGFDRLRRGRAGPRGPA